MKKLIAILLVLVMAMSLAACGAEKEADNGGNTFDPSHKSEGVMTHAEYLAAAEQAEVTVEAFVQAKQGWWEGKVTVYAQDPVGGYFAYNMECSEADAAKLVPGTLIRIKGSKTVYNGLVEIMNGKLDAILTDGTWIAPVTDVTSMLATSEGLEAEMNKKVAFKGLTIEGRGEMNEAFQYGWDGSGEAGSDSDLYFNASYEGTTYTFVVEYYLTGAESAVYQAVQGLQVGDVVDLEGFMYWYEGVQPHITSVTKK